MFHDTLSDFKGGVPHIARFAEEILAESGGLKGFVQQIMADRLMAPAGGAIRLKYDTMLYQFMLKATEHGAVKTPVELMGKEECQAELDEILAQEVERKLHLRLADGTQQVPKDPEPPQAMAQ